LYSCRDFRASEVATAVQKLRTARGVSWRIRPSGWENPACAPPN